ncbi:hypothetical protein H696_05828 [Fonticula alba]|uniref:AMP-dependent synthetase/ligase domain-containing protein n=1 Tax=Fonticula alba TaxID=691883 RepID=A0A058Z0D4_FONAL|nr:hypothetical protein H696_05828 [Fonticula alba]KCV67720.1 hypothetical protein H696_05828 [Fonticula alba]|eukprot:XP_009497904.1 hypothetical protein H696_05828 [Fonticula alba]
MSLDRTPPLLVEGACDLGAFVQAARDLGPDLAAALRRLLPDAPAPGAGVLSVAFVLGNDLPSAVVLGALAHLAAMAAVGAPLLPELQLTLIPDARATGEVLQTVACDALPRAVIAVAADRSPDGRPRLTCTHQADPLLGAGALLPADLPLVLERGQAPAGPPPPGSSALPFATGRAPAQEVRLLTSGSTGAVKLVALSWPAVWRQARAWFDSAFMPAGGPGPGQAGRLPAGGWACLPVSPLAHAYAINAFFAFALPLLELAPAQGDRYPPGQLLFLADGPAGLGAMLRRAAARRVALTVWASPPFYRRAAAASGPGAICDPAPGAWLYCAGSPLDAELRAAAPPGLGAPLLANYGSTETGLIGACWPGRAAGAPVGHQGAGRRRPALTFAGVPLATVELRGPEAGAWPAGCSLRHPAERGEVLVRSAWLGRGYLHAGQVVAFPLDAGGFFRTGDAGALLPGHDGRPEIWLGGRLRPGPCLPAGGGAHLDLRAVEELLLEGLPVSECAAVVIPPGGRGAWRLAVFVAPAAVGHLAASASLPAAVVRLLLEHQPALAVVPFGPGDVAVLPQLPRSLAGKLLYSELVRALPGDRGGAVPPAAPAPAPPPAPHDGPQPAGAEGPTPSG